MKVEDLLASLKGITGSGLALEQYVARLKTKLNLTMDPGDFISPRISMAAPIAVDLWYLFNHVNMLTYVEAIDPDAAFEDRLSFFASKLGGMRAMKGIQSPGEVTQEWIENEVGSFPVWINAARSWIQLMAFEILFHGQVFQYDAVGAVPENTVGYVMIPIGQVGVMEVMTLVQETLTEVDEFALADDEQPNIDIPDLFPPREGWQKGKCYGRHLLEDLGYVIPDIEKVKVVREERNAITFTMDGDLKVARTTTAVIPIETAYGRGKNSDGSDNPAQPGKYVRPKGWLRIWITRDEKWPVPGEFIGILCKPSPVPPHCWWFQDSSPFVYAGNWMDTFDLTSGVIVQKTADVGHPQSGAICTMYRVLVHGVRVDIYSSDYCDYTVGQRVGIYKMGSRSSDPLLVFDFTEQQMQGDPTVGPIVSTDYIIIPIEFYKEA
jgi:hypothetical protein